MRNIASAAALCVGLIALSFGARAQKAPEIRIGMVTTFTTASGSVGEMARKGVDLALEKLGGKMDGIPVRITYADDAGKPDLAKQKTDDMVQRDHVDFLVGYNFTNTLLSSYRSAIAAKTPLLSLNAGPRDLAGSGCSPYFFAVGHQNDMEARAIGLAMNERGVKSLYLVAPNYAAGQEMVEGVKSTFKGRVLGQDLTKWPDQLEFSAEITKIQAAQPQAVFIFLTTQYAVQFINQFIQAGLKDSIPIYSVATVDQFNLPVLGESAEGVLASNYWGADNPNPAMQKLVADFRAKYHQEIGGNAIPGYDAIMLIDSAVRAVDGDLTRKDDLLKALRKADFTSVRGRFSFAADQFPVQDYYLQEVVMGPDKKPMMKTIMTEVQQLQPSAPTKCEMP